MRPAYQTVITFLLLAAFALIQGCTPTPGVKEPVQPEFGPELARASALEAEGDYGAAAALYTDLAQRSRPPQHQDFLLRAAHNLFMDGNLSGARQLLFRVETRDLPAEHVFRKRLQSGEIALAEGRLDDALTQLAHSPPPDAPVLLRERYHRARAEAFRPSGNLLESARELSELDPLIPEPGPRLENQLAIIQRLTTLTERALAFLQTGTPDDFGGWMALSLILRTSIGFPAMSAG